MKKENFLLTSDLHLTDNSIESYRWDVFESLTKLSIENLVDVIIILGDLVDRKDRHSGLLVNTIIDAFQGLITDTGCKIIVLMGNHDQPLNGIPYWKFLSSIGVEYITVPTLRNGVWLLPFSSNPKDDWKSLLLSSSKAIMMHQTISGSVIDGDRIIDVAPHPMPKLPKNIPLFSGDVHRPQYIDGVIYVGAPHPVRFSETWLNRVLLIQESNFKNYKEIFLPSTKRAIIEISNSQELDSFNFRKGDQVRIRYKLDGKNLTSWTEEEGVIKQWAATKEIFLASIEAIFTNEISIDSNEQKVSEMELMKPEEVIRNFAKQENLSDDILNLGLQLLKECK